MVTTPKPRTKPMNRQYPLPEIAWVKPPDDLVLDNTPVENTGQPLIAGALRESLDLAGRIAPQNLIASNFGLCVSLAQELTLKAPDWLDIAAVKQPGIERKSYTPELEGEIPDIVMEFLSATDGGEYSIRQIPPVGKSYFYEQILKVPNYVILEPDSGFLEVYRLQDGAYKLEQPNVEGRHWFESLGLFLGTWRGLKEGRDGYWLRWWTQDEQLLPWAIEQVESERQRAEQEKQRADEAERKAARLAEMLLAQGIDPESID
jgi:Putative restriction endonuclease